MLLKCDLFQTEAKLNRIDTEFEGKVNELDEQDREYGSGGDPVIRICFDVDSTIDNKVSRKSQNDNNYIISAFSIAMDYSKTTSDNFGVLFLDIMLCYLHEHSDGSERVILVQPEFQP